MKRSLIAIASSLACIPFVTSCDSRPASEATDHGHEHEQGHDHGVEELEPVAVTVFGERVLLFMEYPQLVRGTSARFLAHLSVLDTGEPVRSGCVTLTVGPTKLTVEAPARDGLFIPHGSFAEMGGMPATLTIESEHVRETLTLGVVFVHADEHAAQHAAEAAAAEPPSDAVPFLMEQQWKLKLQLAEARPRALTRRLVAPASVRTPEGCEAIVAPSLAGQLLGPASGTLAATGDRVDRGAVMGFIAPPLGASDFAQLRALELEIEVRTLDVERALGEARARLEYSERERERISKLREHQLSTQQELDLSERNLRVARTDLDNANATKAALDRLRAQRAAASGTGDASTIQLPLVSPLAGTVVAAMKIQGESVEAGETVFRVLDTSRVWIEARVSEFDLHLVGDRPRAVATFAALPDRRIEIDGTHERAALRLLPVLDPESRTGLLRCEVANPGGALKAGMLAEVALAVAQVEAAVSIPIEAIVIDQGLPTAYVMLEGELFQKRDLELGVKDGEHVEVRKGIAAGERVVTRGAYLVKLAALSPQSFGHGHQH
ncbi:MAG: efflux RND transporter periplasmic adaptor subunit [Planctomycetota bacterium]